MHVEPELVEAARRGDPGAFEQIVRATYRQVYTLALRILGNPEDAADVTQNVYIRAMRGIRSFRGDANAETWLHRIATNAALNHLRDRKRAAIAVEPETLEAAAGPVADRTDERIDAQEVERALGRLTPAQRAAVVLKDVYGWTCAEIAKEMGVTEGAAKVRLFRARQRLADELARADVVVPMRRKDGTNR